MKVVAALIAALMIVPVAPARSTAGLVAAAQLQVVVSGRQVAFERLTTLNGQLFVAANDAGLRDFLQRVGATLTWDPGARYASIGRLDGQIITLTAGSNAISLDGDAQAIPTAPFIHESTLMLPLAPLAHALGLDVRQFREGYAFVPTIAGVDRRIGQHRTIIEVVASAPMAWRSSFSANKNGGVVTLSFDGFATDLRGPIRLGGRDATVADLHSGGPRGYPTTTLAVHVPRGMRFAAHRTAAGTMDLVLSRDERQLRIADTSSTPVVRPRGPSPPPSPAATPANVPPTAAPTAATSQPAPEPTDNPNASPVATAQPVFVTPAPLPSSSTSPQPGPSAPVKVTDAFATDLTDATRITLTVTGPVSFEWHRLGEPDNRFWVDIHGATLVGPSRALTSRLPFITDIKVSQNKVDPDPTVRVSITPTQAIAVRLGPVANSPDQLGIEIGVAPPGTAEPTSGTGALLAAAASPSPVGGTPGATRRDLVVLDPGHGGTDPGASNRAYGLVEKNITLSIARMVRDLLVRDGWKVVLTRDGDNDVGDPSGADKQELQARVDVANASGARLFVSIHVNSSFSSSPDGTTTYYWHPQDKAFAQTMQAAVVAAAGFGDAGVKRETFYVLHHTIMPSLLVETAYLSNAHDAAVLAQAGTLQRLAAGIERGIMDFTGGPH